MLSKKVSFWKLCTCDSHDLAVQLLTCVCSLRPQGLQHARLPCPSPSPGNCSNSCPLSRWFHPTVSSSVAPFSSRLQSFPASGAFPMSQFFASGGQSIGVSASTSVLPMYIQGWFPLGLTGLTSLLSKDCQESSPAPQFKSISSLALSLFYCPALTSIHNYWENHNFDYTDLYRQSKTPLQNSKSPNRGPLLVVFINVDSVLIIVPGT